MEVLPEFKVHSGRLVNRRIRQPLTETFVTFLNVVATCKSEGLRLQVTKQLRKVDVKLRKSKNKLENG